MAIYDQVIGAADRSFLLHLCIGVGILLAGEMALRIWQAMLGLHGWGERALGTGTVPALAVCVLLVVTNTRAESALVSPRRSRVQAWSLAALLVPSVLALGGRSPFLYFQF